MRQKRARTKYRVREAHVFYHAAQDEVLDTVVFTRGDALNTRRVHVPQTVVTPAAARAQLTARGWHYHGTRTTVNEAAVPYMVFRRRRPGRVSWKK